LDSLVISFEKAYDLYAIVLVSGVADIVGRRFGYAKLPHNPDKSYAGTVAMFLASFLASVL
jgi:dolichol kinase